MSSTREALLDAALALFEERQGLPWSMDEVAKAAGVSRQAVYLHFGGKADLVVQVAEHAKSRHALGRTLEPVDKARTGKAALRAILEAGAEFHPKVARANRAIEAERARDPQIEAAWEGREQSRRTKMREVAERLASEDRLGDKWSVEAAADVLWALTSARVHEDLTARGWSAERYVEQLLRLIDRGMLARK